MLPDQILKVGWTRNRYLTPCGLIEMQIFASVLIPFLLYADVRTFKPCMMYLQI